MKIEFVLCPEAIEEKLESKHHVTSREARQVLLSRPRMRFAEKGHRKGEDVYAALGRTSGGRYLAVYFVYKPNEALAIIISARDMSRRERRTYG